MNTFCQNCVRGIKYGVWSSVNANKHMVLTLPARGNFRIIARHKRFVANQAPSCRARRGWAAHVRR
jgi:hypothetical protein